MLRIRQPLVVSPSLEVTGTLTATLDAVTLSSTATVANGASGTLSKTLDAVTLSSTATVAAGASGTLSKTLDALTLSSSATVADGLTGALNKTLDAVILSASGTLAGAGITGALSQTLESAILAATGTIIEPQVPQIYQQIWIIDERKPKKRVQRAQRRVRKIAQEVQETLEKVKAEVTKRAVETEQLEKAKKDIAEKLRLITLEYEVIEAQSKLNKAIFDAEQKAKQVVERQLQAIEDLRTKRLLEEQEDAEDLEYLLEFLFIDL